MKMNNVIKQFRAELRSVQTVTDAIIAASEDDLKYAAFYFYTNGTGDAEKGDSQNAEYRAFRERVRYALQKDERTNVTIGFNKSEGVMELTEPRKRAPQQKGSKGKDKSKPAKALSSTETKLAEQAKTLTKADKAMSLARQAHRMGLTIDDVVEAMAAYQPEEDAA